MTIKQTNLFSENLHHHSTQNLLPYDGIVNYHGQIFTASEIEDFFNLLSTGINWEHDEVMMFGKKIITKRKVAWYGNKRQS